MGFRYHACMSGASSRLRCVQSRSDPSWHGDRACRERDIDVIALTAPPSDYKLKWTKMGKRIDDFGLTLSTNGFFHLNIWHGKVRNELRQAFDHVPEAVRRFTISLTNRNLKSSQSQTPTPPNLAAYSLASSWPWSRLPSLESAAPQPISWAKAHPNARSMATTQSHGSASASMSSEGASEQSQT